MIQPLITKFLKYLPFLSIVMVESSCVMVVSWSCCSGWVVVMSWLCQGHVMIVVCHYKVVVVLCHGCLMVMLFLSCVVVLLFSCYGHVDVVS